MCSFGVIVNCSRPLSFGASAVNVREPDDSELEKKEFEDLDKGGNIILLVFACELEHSVVEFSRAGHDK